MLHPEVVCFERSQRPDAFRAAQERRQRGRRPREFRKEEFHIAAALQTVIHRRGITEVNAEAALRLGKYRGNRAYFRVELDEGYVVPRCNSLQNYAANQKWVRLFCQLEARPFSRLRAAPVRAHHQPRRNSLRILAAGGDHKRRRARLHSLHRNSAAYLRSRSLGGRQQHLLHFRVRVTQGGLLLRCRGSKFARRTAHAQVNPRNLLRALSAKKFVKPKSCDFGHAPRHHVLAADAIAETRLLLENQNLRTTFRHALCQSGGRHPSANGDQVIVWRRHVRFSPVTWLT